MAPFCWAPCDFESVHEIFVMPSAFFKPEQRCYGCRKHLIERLDFVTHAGSSDLPPPEGLVRWLQ